MRITHYYHWALRGEFGTGIAVRGWCRALAAAGDDVVLMSGSGKPGIDPPAGVEIVELRETPGAFQSPRTFRDRFAGSDLVVLHGGWDPHNLLAATEARRLGVPYMVNPHGAYYPQVFRRRKTAVKKAWWTALERPHLAKAFAVHLFFDDEIEHLTSRGLHPTTVVAPNGFEAPEGRRWEQRGEPYLLWLGRYDPQHKGLDLLLHAVHLLPEDDRPSIRLHGVDWHGERGRVEALVDRLGLHDRIVVGEPIYGEAKWKLLTQAAGFLYPSRWDASPIAVVEAVSLGVPTLVTSFPLGSFIASHGGAISVSPEPPSIAEGLRAIVEPEAAAIGARGAQVIRDELSWTVVAASWQAQVSALLSRDDQQGDEKGG